MVLAIFSLINRIKVKKQDAENKKIELRKEAELIELRKKLAEKNLENELVIKEREILELKRNNEIKQPNLRPLKKVNKLESRGRHKKSCNKFKNPDGICNCKN